MAVIARTHPDILVLTGIDYDHDLRALSELAALVAAAGGPDYAHLYARRPNSGMASGIDLDGDGRLGGPGDAQGFGMFSGQGGMAILSRLPVDGDVARDFHPTQPQHSACPRSGIGRCRSNCRTVAA